MKFLTKINRQYLKTMGFSLILLSVLGWLILRNILNEEIKENISEKEYAVIREIKNEDNLPNIYPTVETKKIAKKKSEPQMFKKVYIKDEFENETEPYLEYTNTVEIKNQFYLIIIRHSLLENDTLFTAISLPLLLLLIISFIILFLITKKLNKTVWKDFENNLIEIEKFTIKNKQKLQLKSSGIDEFNRLNKTVKNLTNKLKKDYFTLKEFTENASHELQTPLSIILLNLEEILQQKLSEKTFKLVVSSVNAVKRLSNLNQSLILLAKIENNQYHSDNVVIINDIISEKIDEFSPFFDKKNIRIKLNLTKIFKVNADKELVRILVNNLLSNAVKHNVENGKIIININNNGFEICNTGPENSLKNENIFDRFTKENSESFGLGLSIVKQICESLKLIILYKKTNLHCFLIKKVIK